jgi:hypothetical protein
MAIEHLNALLTESLNAVNSAITKDLPQLEAELQRNNLRPAACSRSRYRSSNEEARQQPARPERGLHVA